MKIGGDTVPGGLSCSFTFPGTLLAQKFDSDLTIEKFFRVGKMIVLRSLFFVTCVGVLGVSLLLRAK